MERSIEIFMMINLFVIGLSHMLRPRAWAEFFIGWREKGTTGVFYTAFLHFPFGAGIVAFHNVWRGIPMIVTILGWGWLIKGFLYFNFPKIGIWSLSHVSLHHANKFAAPGAVFVALSGLLAWSLFVRPSL